MSANVERVNEWEKEPGKKRWYVDFADGSKAVCFAEQAATLETGKPLPDGWIIEAPKQEGWTPMLKAPRKPGGGGFSGGAAAFRNTKEGQAIEQERMDRRTALMQATAISLGAGPAAVAKIADDFYLWLRATAAGAGVALPPSAPAPTSSPESRGEKPSVAVGKGAGEAGQGSSLGEDGGPCPHPSFKRVNGKTVCAKCGWERAA